MDILLKNLCWQHDNKVFQGDIRIKKNIIIEINPELPAHKREIVFDLTNHFAYPGLINAHDHLEMNLYGKLGNPPYNNYTEWAKDIYKPHQSPVAEIEKVSIKDRLLWGGFKNLISGATTVVHHNPWNRILGKSDFPVKVLKKIAWAHSLAFEKKVVNTFPSKKNVPFVIHAAEGVDELAFSEIDKLNKLGLIKSNTVIVHGIGVDETALMTMEIQKASLVWCPVSNLYMFNKTAPINNLRGRVKLLLGSDSTLTGSPTLLHEMRAAVKSGLATNSEVFGMVTQTPSEVFKLNASLALKQSADLFIAPRKHENYFENLVQLTPSDISLVMVEGKIRLADVKFSTESKSLKQSIKIQGTTKKTDVDIPSLKSRICKKVPQSVLEANPLWNLIEV